VGTGLAPSTGHANLLCVADECVSEKAWKSPTQNSCGQRGTANHIVALAAAPGPAESGGANLLGRRDLAC
jgi:hypothetical protein